MLKAIVGLEWRSTRAWIVAAAVAVAALPVVSVGRIWPSSADGLATFLAQLDLWSLFYPLTAAVVGIVMGNVIWRSDRRGGFVYALTLPVARWRYVGLQFVAGLVWLAAISAALWLVALVTVATIDLPSTLRSYPSALAVKFFLASLSVFTAAFALASMPERVRRIAGRTLALVVVAQLLLLLLGKGPNLVAPVAETLIGKHGPFAALGGRWMLIDV